jgi:hypothetical protein
MPLSADDIRTALAALDEELRRTDDRAEVVIVGGAALVLLFRRARAHEMSMRTSYGRPHREYAMPRNEWQRGSTCLRTG